MKLVSAYAQAWADHEGKITLGISAYGFKTTPRDVQKTGIILKGKLKERGVSLRLIPNADTALSSATSHHNKLGLSDNHVELIIVRGANGAAIIAESVGAQNITALAARDQGRPKRDAFVGMLPPKLARMMVNLAPVKAGRILDPFCGTGVLLQEAALLGYDVYGTDLVPKMVQFTKANLDWLIDTHHVTPGVTLDVGDAMTYHWRTPVDAVACEAYLGQPFSAPPSPGKLTEVRGNCNHIISEFLRNIAPQLSPGAPLCIAVPAWRDSTGRFTHLPLVDSVGSLGYNRTTLRHVRNDQLLYYREDQVVARELLLLTRR
jgi:tRNA (guanine10-N2)-dimethyltransferase